MRRTGPVKRPLKGSVKRAVKGPVKAAVTAAVGVTLLLAGCSQTPDFDLPGPAQIEVDSPDLRQAKKQAGVEPCRPGSGASELPAITLSCFGGGPEVNLATLEGPLVVNLWAVSCGPCREEMPVLEEFHQRYGDRVPIIGIDYSDPQVGAAMRLVEDTGVTYPLLADPQQDLLGADPFPTMIRLPMLAFVRPDGSVRILAEVVDDLQEMVALTEDNLGIQL